MVSTKVPHTEFPKTIAAARALDAADERRWEAQFALAEALVKECGAPGPDGVNNGALTKAKKVISELKLKHYYTLRRLEQFRLIAHVFEPRRRLRAVPFDAHYAARNHPDMLTKIAKDAEQRGKPVTVSLVTKTIKAWEALEKAKTRDQSRAGQAASVVAVHEANSAAGKARELGAYFGRRVEKHVQELSAETIKDLARRADEVATTWSSCAAHLRRHLSGGFAEAAE